MAYKYSLNQTPATGAEAMFQLKAVLTTPSTGAGWTVLSSSDGSTYNASGDQITASGSGASGMANDSAWFVVRDPSGSGGRQLCIQRGTANYSWRIKYSASAGFSGGSPSATQTPSAADEVFLCGSGGDSSPIFSSHFYTSDGSYRCHIVADNDAASKYSFWMACYPTGGGAPNQALILDGLITGTFPTEDDDPVVFSCSGYTSSPLVLSTFSSDSHVSGQWYGPAAWLRKGETDQAFVAVPALSLYSGGVQTVPSGLPTNPHNGKDEGVPVIYARRAGATVYSGSNPTGYKGVSRLCRWMGTSRSTGSTMGTKTRIALGDLTLPWPDSATTPVV